MRITDMEWAVDEDIDTKEINLPEECVIKGEFERDVIDDDIANELSDRFGWLINSFSVSSYPVKIRELIEGQARKENDTNPVLDKEFDVWDYDSLEDCCKECIQTIEEDDIYADAEYNLVGVWRKERGFTDADADYAASLGYEGCWFLDYYIKDEDLKAMSDDELSDELTDAINARETFPEYVNCWETEALDELYLQIDAEIQRRKAA